ncbi:DUF1643 domain-containing protein [Alkalicoccobacillus gibsonii]|uniref:DUF1643 domain-containing protein n=1 Tax=Alkalicoccobacillus gibsonii TaxID=79881 RepID=UPI003F7BCCB4
MNSSSRDHRHLLQTETRDRNKFQNCYNQMYCMEAHLKDNNPEPVGTENDAAILAAVYGADLIVAAWGTMGNRMQRDRAVLKLLKEKDVYCLSTTRDGHPRHPLYVRREQEPVLYGG